MFFKKFIAQNGDTYIFVGASVKAIMRDTNFGTGFAGEEFIKSESLTFHQVMHLKNLKHYQSGIEAINKGTPSYLIAILDPGDSI